MKSFSKTLVLIASTALSVVVSSHTTAEEHEDKEHKRAAYAVDVRQSLFTLMGSNMGPLGAMARGKIPVDAAVAEKNATRIAQLAEMITDSFQRDTRAHDLETAALDGIWDNFARFEEKAAATTEAASALASTATAGNEGSIKKAIAALGKTCGSCHDDFKEEQD